jgi:hypothetical protein
LQEYLRVVGAESEHGTFLASYVKRVIAKLDVISDSDGEA